MRGKVLSYMPAFQPYRGKPAVRNDGEGRGNVGIIRSPVRASTLPDCGGRSVMSVPTAISETSSQIIPLKSSLGFPGSEAKFRPLRPFAFEMRRWIRSLGQRPGSRQECLRRFGGQGLRWRVFGDRNCQFRGVTSSSRCTCAPVKANGAARKAHERDKRAQKPDCVAGHVGLEVRRETGKE